MKRYTDEEQPTQAQCYDCGLPYGEPGWMDVLVPDDIWDRISPSPYRGGGLLCITCIERRCIEAGLQNVPIAFQSGNLQIGEVVGIQPIRIEAIDYDPSPDLQQIEDQARLSDLIEFIVDNSTFISVCVKDWHISGSSDPTPLGLDVSEKMVELSKLWWKMNAKDQNR